MGPSTAPGFQNGLIFRPGTSTRDSGGNITGGVPYVGNIIPASEFSKQTPAWQKLLSRAYTFGLNSQVANGLTQGSIASGNPFNGIVQEGTNGIPLGLAQHRYNNFQPRVGFAYDYFGDGKTAFRGGAGIFNERIRQNNQSFDGLGNPPLAYTPQLFNGNIDNVSPALGLLFRLRSPVPCLRRRAQAARRPAQSSRPLSTRRSRQCRRASFRERNRASMRCSRPTRAISRPSAISACFTRIRTGSPKRSTPTSAP